MGSFGWDDRRHEMHDPATFPLFESNEMANTSQVVVLRNWSAAPYAARFRDVFSPASTSIKMQLTEQRLRGKKLFDSPEGGTCAPCQ
jgi:cytochrome c peroxidase